MKTLLALVIAGILAGPVAAQEAVAAAVAEPATEIEQPAGEMAPEAPEVESLIVLDAADVSLSDFQWTSRPVVVFADTDADPRFSEQMELLLARPEELIKRDVVILTDVDPKARSDIRLTLRPRGFMLVLIDKDGTINLRKPAPWDVRELTRAIDKMPSRQEEIRAEKAGG